MISIEVKDTSNKFEKQLEEIHLYLKHRKYLPFLQQAGLKGVQALKERTPIDTGLTAESWDYEILIDKYGIRIEWINTNVVNGWFNVALSLQYGHGTRRGGYVEGIDYINPALKPVFDEIAERLWEGVASVR